MCTYVVWGGLNGPPFLHLTVSDPRSSTKRFSRALVSRKTLAGTWPVAFFWGRRPSGGA
jgi:hypothetical protein